MTDTEDTEDDLSQVETCRPCKFNLLTPWSRVLLEKLTGSAASQEIPRISGTRRFITANLTARIKQVVCHCLIP